MLAIDPEFDVLVVHRDAEAQTVDHRLAEIQAALEDVALQWYLIPVIPVRMTEAWLLLDESAIRVVAGRPTGIDPLNLPSVWSVESEPDPKFLAGGTCRCLWAVGAAIAKVQARLSRPSSPASRAPRPRRSGL
jgi:hypothetical protein